MVTRTLFSMWVLIITLLFPLFVVKTASPGKSTESCRPDDERCNRNQNDIGTEEFVAIQQIHHLIDDDQNGNVDPSESDEFMRDELQYTEGFERLSIFHGNDKLISSGDLWQAWKKSTVYNWTTEDVLQWLVKHVELPIYTETFRAKTVDGPILPRLAVTNKTYMVDVLGIKNAIHRQKISVKAMDLVLFGPPKEKHKFVRDLALILLLVIALGGIWFALNQHRLGKKNMLKFRKRLEALQKAELSLSALQEKLAAAEESQRSGLGPHSDSADNMDTLSEDSDGIRRELNIDEKCRLIEAEEELTQMRTALIQAEKRNKWTPPQELQIWLQLCYETEHAYFLLKKKEAYTRVQIVKETCDKMKKKRGAVLGAFRIVTDHSMEESDHRIHEAKESLEEVNRIFKEKRHRWQRVEKLSDLTVINNPGKDALLQITQQSSGVYNKYAGVVPSSKYRLQHMATLDVDDLELDEDLPPGYPGPGFAPGTLRQRPRDLGPGSTKPRPTTPVQAAMTIRSRTPERSLASTNSTASVSNTASPEGDKPVFSLGESSPESPISLPGLESPLNGSHNLPIFKPIHNSHSCVINQTSSPSKRDSVGNSSLPLQEENDGTNGVTVSRSRSEASLLKNKVTRSSLDNQSVISSDSGSINGKSKTKPIKILRTIFGLKSKDKRK